MCNKHITLLPDELAIYPAQCIDIHNHMSRYNNYMSIDDNSLSIH